METKVKIPNIQPFQALNINQSSFDMNASNLKEKFREKLISLRDSTNLLSKIHATLSYELLMEQLYKSITGKFVNNQGIYTFYPSTIHDFALCADHEQIVKLIQGNNYNKNYIDKKDIINRTALYIAARSGYHKVVKILLEAGASINIQCCNNFDSTALHVATYYGQKQIIQMLDQYGADQNVKNSCGNQALDEAYTKSSIKVIKTDQEDQVVQLCSKLYQNKFICNINIIKVNNASTQSDIIAYRLAINKNYLPKHYQNVYDKAKIHWETVYHGTKESNLQSIIKNGLKIPDGKTIKVTEQNIQPEVTINGIDNWALAIFVSPSLWYSLHYADEIKDQNEKKWGIILELKVQPNCYTTYDSTLFQTYKKKLGEEKVQSEMRVPAEVVVPGTNSKIKNDCHRVSSESTLCLYNILLVNYEYVQNVTNYKELIDNYRFKSTREIFDQLLKEFN